MNEIEKKAKNLGYTSILLHAQCPVTGFNKKLGFQVEGDIFTDAGIDHRRMTKNL